MSRTATLVLALGLSVSAIPGFSKSLSGTVTDTMDAAGYTYVQLDVNGQSVWAAGPQTVVHKGDTLGIDDHMPMANFHSSSLNRDFKVVYFVNAFSTGGATPANTPSPAAQLEPIVPAAPVHGAMTSGAPATATSVDKLTDGQSIAEIQAQKKDLVGKTVKLRAQVTKYMGGIMGTNWVHVRDNSAADLIATTADKAAVGEVVVVEGKVAVDKDFGYGYVYPLLIESAKLSKE